MSASATLIGQSSFDFIWWLCLAILVGLFIGAAWCLYWLGKLPGETASRRGHPQATAIAVCGWLGLLFPPLWPVALIWAYLVPAGREPAPPPDLTGLKDALKTTSDRIAEIERQLGKAGAR
ncbi:DUF3302 domain-containing protein [Bradyrhizobium sp. CCGUVB14]|uniref:DUF3302 domain-containing protein n=1 Tax=Bradyrhizobium sp. CCGUVB14 TaxID=2949628 RepID=UPI0020B3543C|nr:DUF3302 domain-containing protein [Bradyrhizobium sp. CCGUVB14]MCP3440642.1 DUF3302 domain-containing protein [Bradyrhizobium sp. CCGUVB14]